VAGNLIPNPDARWQITDGTRDFIRTQVRDAMEGGWSNDVLATKLSDSYAFSAERAMVIARTETIRASNQGSLASYTAAGVTEKEWTTAEDDRVSEDCEANGAQGPIPIGEDFDSGDDVPPAHPNCRCTIVPVVHFASESKPTEE
jgi:SPP1 gp7 family putative phage head morphogenesis protein